MAVSFTQLLNASSPMVSSTLPSSKYTFKRDLQFEKLFFSIDATFFGMVILLSPLPSNTLFFIVVTFLGISMLSRAVQLQKAAPPILLSLLPASNVTSERAVQPLKAPSPISVTLLEMFMLLSPLSINANLPIFVTFSGISMLVRAVQL